MASPGTDNAIFHIGAGHAARFPLRLMDPSDSALIVEGQARASAECHRSCPVASPKPVGIGRPRSSYPMPWLVQTWVEGQTATPTGLSDSSSFTLDLAQLISSLRAADVKGRVFDGRGRGGDLRDHDAWMGQCFAKSEALLDVGRLRAMWAQFRGLPPLDRQVMSHKDLIPGNLLVRSGRLVGVIDTGGFGPADPALDLVVGRHRLDRGSRGAAWALQQAPGLVWYYRATNPVMANLGRSTILRLIEVYGV